MSIMRDPRRLGWGFAHVKVLACREAPHARAICLILIEAKRLPNRIRELILVAERSLHAHRFLVATNDDRCARGC